MSPMEEVEDQGKEIKPNYNEFEDEITYCDRGEALVVCQGLNHVQS